MYTLIDYYGLEIQFRNDASLPIIVFGKRGDRVSSMMLRFNNGLMETPELIRDEKDLDAEDMESFRLLVEKNCSELIKSWLDIFLYHRPVEKEIIKYNIRNKA